MWAVIRIIRVADALGSYIERDVYVFQGSDAEREATEWAWNAPNYVGGWLAHYYVQAVSTIEDSNPQGVKGESCAA